LKIALEADRATAKKNGQRFPHQRRLHKPRPPEAREQLCGI